MLLSRTSVFIEVINNAVFLELTAKHTLITVIWQWWRSLKQEEQNVFAIEMFQAFAWQNKVLTRLTNQSRATWKIICPQRWSFRHALTAAYRVIKTSRVLWTIFGWTIITTSCLLTCTMLCLDLWLSSAKLLIVWPHLRVFNDSKEFSYIQK